MGAELSFGLAGRRAIVTGHRGGIGGAIFDVLARDGVEVTGLDLPDFDLSDTGTLENRLAAVVADGPVDILVNCAGVTVLGSVTETSLAEVERVFRVNFLAAYALMRAVLPGMAEHRRGPLARREQAGVVQVALRRLDGILRVLLVESHRHQLLQRLLRSRALGVAARLDFGDKPLGTIVGEETHQ